MTLPTTTTLNDCEPDDSDMFGPPRSSPPPSHQRGIDGTNGGYHSHRSRVPMISPKLRQREERKRILQLCAHKLERIKDSETNLRRSVCINNTYCRLTDELRREKQSRYLANLPKSETKPETARDNIFNPYNSCSLDNSNHQLTTTQQQHNHHNNKSALSTAASNVNTTNYHQRPNDDTDSDEDIIDVDDGYLNNNKNINSQHHHQHHHHHNNNNNNYAYNSNHHNNNMNNTYCDIKNHHHQQPQHSLGHEGQLGHVQQQQYNHCHNHCHNHNHNHHNGHNDISTTQSQSSAACASTASSSTTSNSIITTATTTTNATNSTTIVLTQRQKRQLSNSNFDTDLERLDRELNAINAPMPLIDPEITQGAEQLEKAISSRKRLRSEDESDRLVREALSQFYIPPPRFISAIEDCPLDVGSGVGVGIGGGANCLNMGNISPKRQKINASDLDLDFDVNQNSKDFEVIMDALRLGTPSPTPSLGSDSCGQAAMMSEAASVFHNLVVTSLET